MKIWSNTHSFETYLDRIATVQGELNFTEWNAAAQALIQAWQEERRVFIAGNGGSASLAQHFATDWTKGLMMSCGKSLLATSLSENIALFSATANDLGYEEVFRKQLELHGSFGGILVAISSSGNSKNILNAALFAKEHSMDVIALTGKNGQKLLTLSDYKVIVPTSNIQLIEDIHSMFGHFVLEMIYSKSIQH